MDIIKAHKAIKDELWRRGELAEMLLDPTQLELYRALMDSKASTYVWECSRKLGKSYALAVIAIELAMKNPGIRINFASPTGKMSQEILVPIISEILTTCPDPLKPVFKVQNGHYEFPNKAFIVLFGADDEAACDRGRGPQSHCNIVDEAAFVPCLDYLLNSVLAPQTLRTGGRLFLASTPPKSPGHAFCAIADAAEANKAYQHRHIYQNGMLTKEQIDKFLTSQAEARGMTLEQFKTTSDFRREYMALRVIDRESAVIPEWEDAEPFCVVDHPTPPFLNYIISIDPGMTDRTAELLMYHDFKQDLYIIDDERLIQKGNTSLIAEGINSLKGNRTIYLNVIDDSTSRICSDLFQYHKIIATPAAKDNSEGAINLLRVNIQNHRILINPRCVQLIRQLRTAVWDSKNKSFQRTKLDGHFDLIDALKYGIRTLNDLRHLNPYPAEVYDRTKTYVPEKQPKVNQIAQALHGNTIFGRKLLGLK
jgi:hypothetical protein